MILRLDINELAFGDKLCFGVTVVIMVWYGFWSYGIRLMTASPSPDGSVGQGGMRSVIQSKLSVEETWRDRWILMTVQIVEIYGMNQSRVGRSFQMVDATKKKRLPQVARIRGICRWYLAEEHVNMLCLVNEEDHSWVIMYNSGKFRITWRYFISRDARRLPPTLLLLADIFSNSYCQSNHKNQIRRRA